ncbi:MAG: hypothetical protein V3V59_01545 [Thermodesulfovibrionales bacterium]
MSSGKVKIWRRKTRELIKSRIQQEIDWLKSENAKALVDIDSDLKEISHFIHQRDTESIPGIITMKNRSVGKKIANEEVIDRLQAMQKWIDGETKNWKPEG